VVDEVDEGMLLQSSTSRAIAAAARIVDMKPYP
jgi:hypothetical protein